MVHLIKSAIHKEKIMIKALKIEYSQIVNEENFTSCIRHQGSEQDENKAEKCRQHFCDKFSKASLKNFGSFLHSSEKLQ